MSTAQQRIPGPDHPITVQEDSARVVVTVGDRVIADTSSALKMQEASYAPVFYVPLGDVDSAVLEPSDTSSYCPYKGRASYYSVKTSDGVVQDAIWYYPEPYEAVAEIADHVAFYPDRVEIDVAQ